MDLFKDLAWLPRPPADFNALCRSLIAGPDGNLYGSVRALASYGLDLNGLSRLAKLVERHRASGIAPLVPIRLGVVSNATATLLTDPLIASAVRHNFLLELLQAPYGTAAQELLDANSQILRSQPDFILLALDHRGLPLTADLSDFQAADTSVNAAIDLLKHIRANVRTTSNAVCIFQTVPRPVEGLLGSYDRVHKGTLHRSIDNFNRVLVDTFGDGDIIFDVASLAETIGLAEWHSPGDWHHSKLPFSPSYLPLYADHVCRLMGALRGRSRRCLILDLDNTIWGGVVGDEGIDGIRLGSGDALGEAFTAVQQMALDLRSRGIALAVASKNDETRAIEPFRSHSEMILRESHIAVMRANWEDKAANIRAISESLSLGLESMVFLDDNPAERALVRQFLPDVAVPELPDDPALYPRTIWAAGYFEVTAFSTEDAGRAEYYQDNAQRSSVALSANNLDDYLQSLDMRIYCSPFDAAGRSRITQLINKSNQFNLTTRRYTTVDIERFATSPRHFTLQVRLTDRFGDNGMISVIICHKTVDAWEIDTWLMSCRVLKRRVEDAVLHEIVTHARDAGAKVIVGRFIPTERNQLVRDHYQSLGFELIDEKPAGETVWHLNIAAYEAKPLPMKVSGSDIETTAAR
jgi:FkbH-like protein